MIGSGGTSQVFVGTLDRQRDVAVKKFVATTSITTAVMAAVVREIQLSLRLKHENIVEANKCFRFSLVETRVNKMMQATQIYGVSLMVPHVALVLELMNRGSLFDLLRSVSTTARRCIVETLIFFCLTGTSTHARELRVGRIMCCSAKRRSNSLPLSQRCAAKRHWHASRPMSTATRRLPSCPSTPKSAPST
jgi:serine/threonine protein kinase